MYQWRKGIATWEIGKTLYISVPFTWLVDEAERIAKKHKGYERDDETGRLIDSLKAESEAIKTAARIYRWTGKLDYVYGFSTAGGIGDKKLADKSNKRIIEKVSRFTRIDLMREGW